MLRRPHKPGFADVQCHPQKFDFNFVTLDLGLLVLSSRLRPSGMSSVVSTSRAPASRRLASSKDRREFSSRRRASSSFLLASSSLSMRVASSSFCRTSSCLRASSFFRWEVSSFRWTSSRLRAPSSFHWAASFLHRTSSSRLRTLSSLRWAASSFLQLLQPGFKLPIPCIFLLAMDFGFALLDMIGLAFFCLRHFMLDLNFLVVGSRLTHHC